MSSFAAEPPLRRREQLGEQALARDEGTYLNRKKPVSRDRSAGPQIYLLAPHTHVLATDGWRQSLWEATRFRWCGCNPHGGIIALIRKDVRIQILFPVKIKQVKTLLEPEHIGTLTSDLWPLEVYTSVV